MKTYIVITILCLLVVIQSIGKTASDTYIKRTSIKNPSEYGLEFCEWFAYYFNNSSTPYCQQTVVGNLLISFGAILYIIAMFAIMIAGIFLFRNINNF